MPGSEKHEYMNNNLQFPDEPKQTSLHHSLEQLLSKTQRNHKNGPLDKLVSDKIKTLKATVSALLDEIKLRQNLDYVLTNTIDEEICTKHSEIMQLPKVRPGYDFELFKEISKQKTQLENMVRELEKEKRNEQVECWRDLMFLRKYLLSAFKDYWDLVKKNELLTGNEKM